MYGLLHSQYGPIMAGAVVVLLALAALNNSTRDLAHKSGFPRAIGLFAGYLLASIGAQVLEGLHLDTGAKYARVGSYMLFAFGSVRLMTSAAVWLTRTRRGRVTPKIMVEVVDAVLYLVAVTVVLRVTLKVDIGALLATPAILSLVFGLALQETLGNLFAGLSLQAESPFAVGDWISVGPHTGRVVQTTWRQTRIITARHESVTIPNSAVAKEHVINYSRASEGIARELLVEVDYESPPNAVKAASLDVLASHPRVRPSPPPLFRVNKWDGTGIQYQIRFFTDQFEDVDSLADELLTTLWYRVRREGFAISPMRQTVVERASRDVARNHGPDMVEALAGVDFLRPFSQDALAQLASRSRLCLFGRGETVVRQGQPGATFFLVVSGALAARTENGAGEAARLGPGDFFGETSLLADESQPATIEAVQDTVLVLVERKDFSEILRSHGGLEPAVAEVLARRAAESASAASKRNGSILQDAKDILGTVRDIFQLRS